MKKLTSIIILCIMIMSMFTFTPMSASAATEGYYTYKVSNGEATITYVDTSISGDIIIPSTLGGYPVTTIGDKAFAYCSDITSIEILDTVTTIGVSPFHGSIGLLSINVSANNENYSSINGVLFNKEKTELIQYPVGKTDKSYVIPDGVTTISDFAFGMAMNLENIKIPSTVVTIGICSFAMCTELKTIELSDNLITIGEEALYSCEKLTSIDIPDSVTFIGEEAFMDCIALENVEIGAGVESLGSRVFLGCIALKEIKVSENNNYFSSSDGVLFDKNKTNLIFYPAQKEDKIYKIPYGVAEIGEYAFEECNNLTSVEFPDSLKKFSWQAFYRCNSLTSIKIPDSVVEIGEQAFCYCAGLRDIEVPESAKIGAYAFHDTAWYNNQPDGVVYLGNVLYCYKGDMPENSTIVVKKGTTKISSSAFRGQKNLVGIEIADSVTVIEDYAFEGCRKLSEVVIGNSVTTIGKFIFIDCYNLTSINIPKSVTKIDEWAFWDCYNLERVYISDLSAWCNIDFVNDSSNPLFGAELYLNNELVTNLVIPEDVTEIKKYAFSGCYNLLSVEIPENVTTIGEKAFSWCVQLLNITVDDNNANYCSLDGNLFSKDKGTFLQYAIGKKENSYIIPEGVKIISDGVFDWCENLISIEIPDSIDKIGIEAFFDCESLEDVYYYGKEEQWANINIGDNNDALLEANIYFSSKPIEVEFMNYSNDPVHVLVTTYDAKSSMLDIIPKTIESTQKETAVVNCKTQKYKILYWDSLSNLKPVYDSIEKEL